MAKRKYVKPRRHHYRRSFFRKHKPKTVPIETLVTAVSLPFVPSRTGWSNLASPLMAGDMHEAMKAAVMGFVGIDIDAPQYFNPMAALNPFDFDNARYTKMLLMSSLIGMVRKKITGKYTAPLFKKIPIVGKWIS